MPAVMTILTAYLLATLPLLPLGGLDRRRGAVLVFHLTALAGVLLLPRARGTGFPARVLRTLGDWGPLLLVPLLYVELPFLMDGLPGPVRYHDETIGSLERRVFGGEPAYSWAGAWPWLPLSELLHACYFSYYILIYAPPLILYLGLSGPRTEPDRTRAFGETVLALVLAFLACFVVFVAFPVQGPRYLGVPPGIPEGPARRLVLRVLQGASSRGAAFPSSHVSVAVAQAWMAVKHQPRIGWPTAALAVGLAAGAVYGGFHYGVDALAGAVVGALAALAAAPLRRRLDRRPPGFTWTPEAV